MFESLFKFNSLTKQLAVKRTSAAGLAPNAAPMSRFRMFSAIMEEICTLPRSFPSEHRTGFGSAKDIMKLT